MSAETTPEPVQEPRTTAQILATIAETQNIIASSETTGFGSGSN